MDTYTSYCTYLRAIREGLSIAINCNITKLEIESDAQAAVNLPLDYHTANHPFNPLIDESQVPRGQVL